MAAANTILSEGARYVVVAAPGPDGSIGPQGISGPAGAAGAPGSEGSWRQAMAFEIFDIRTDAVTRGWWCPALTRIDGDVFCDIDIPQADPIQWTIEFWDGAGFISLFTSPDYPTLPAGERRMKATPNQYTTIPHATFLRLRLPQVGTPMQSALRGARTYNSGDAAVTSFLMNFPNSALTGDTIVVLIATTDGASVTPPDGVTLRGTTTSTADTATITTHEFVATRPASSTGWTWTTSAPCAVAAATWAYSPTANIERFADTTDVEFERNSVTTWPHAITASTAVAWHAAASPQGLNPNPVLSFDPEGASRVTTASSRTTGDNALLSAASYVTADTTPIVVASIDERLIRRRRGWVTGAMALVAPQPTDGLAASFMAQLSASQPTA